MFVRRELTVPVPIDVAYAYLVDLTHAAQWDSATTAVSRLEGDGAVGTRYDLRVALLGREHELTVETVEAEPPVSLVFRGTDGTTWLTHRLTLRALDPAGGGGTAVVLRTDYVAGLWRNVLASTTGKPRAERQADQTALRLYDALAGLVADLPPR